jgi:hypothetical protein
MIRNFIIHRIVFSALVVGVELLHFRGWQGIGSWFAYLLIQHEANRIVCATAKRMSFAVACAEVPRERET